jgi:hypothetical protein
VCRFLERDDAGHNVHMQHTGEDEVLWPLLQEWMRSAGVLRGEQVARVADELRESLAPGGAGGPPLVSQHITVAEWYSHGEHGRAAIAPRMLPLLFGACSRTPTPGSET